MEMSYICTYIATKRLLRHNVMRKKNKKKCIKSKEIVKRNVTSSKTRKYVNFGGTEALIPSTDAFFIV